MFKSIATWWKNFESKHETGSQFLMFFILSNGITVLQLALMPVLRNIFNGTSLVETNFQVFPIGTGADGSSPFYIFDYAAGALPGGGGGLAYFLAVQITLLIAQIINFFLQRNVTFKSNTSMATAALCISSPTSSSPSPPPRCRDSTRHRFTTSSWRAWDGARPEERLQTSSP